MRELALRRPRVKRWRRPPRRIFMYAMSTWIFAVLPLGALVDVLRGEGVLGGFSVVAAALGLGLAIVDYRRMWRSIEAWWCNRTVRPVDPFVWRAVIVCTVLQTLVFVSQLLVR